MTRRASTWLTLVGLGLFAFPTTALAQGFGPGGGMMGGGMPGGGMMPGMGGGAPRQQAAPKKKKIRRPARRSCTRLRAPATRWLRPAASRRCRKSRSR
ncbi:MAG: hypothetical protein QM756_11470 [Polyangiaceae bacterium]